MKLDITIFNKYITSENGITDISIDESTGNIIVTHSDKRSYSHKDMTGVLFVRDNLYNAWDHEDLRVWIIEVTKYQAEIIRVLHEQRIENSVDLCRYQERMGYRPLYMVHNGNIVGLYKYDKYFDMFRLVAITKNLKDTLKKNNYCILKGSIPEKFDNRYIKVVNFQVLMDILANSGNMRDWVDVEDIRSYQLREKEKIQQEYFNWFIGVPETISDNGAIYKGADGIISCASDIAKYMEAVGFNEIDYSSSIRNIDDQYISTFDIFGMRHVVKPSGIYLPLKRYGPISAEMFDGSVRDYKVWEIDYDFESEQVNFKLAAEKIIGVLEHGVLGCNSRIFKGDSYKPVLDSAFEVDFKEYVEKTKKNQGNFEKIKEAYKALYSTFDGRDMDIGERLKVDIKRPLIMDDNIRRAFQEKDALIVEKDESIYRKDTQLEKLAGTMKNYRDSVKDQMENMAGRIREQDKEIERLKSLLKAQPSICSAREMIPDQFRSALRLTLDAAEPKKYTIKRFKDGKNELVLKQAAEDEHINEFIGIMRKKSVDMNFINSKGYMRQDVAALFIKFMKTKGYWK